MNTFFAFVADKQFHCFHCKIVVSAGQTAFWDNREKSYHAPGKRICPACKVASDGTQAVKPTSVTSRASQFDEHGVSAIEARLNALEKQQAALESKMHQLICSLSVVEPVQRDDEESK